MSLIDLTTLGDNGLHYVIMKMDEGTFSRVIYLISKLTLTMKVVGLGF